MWWGLLEYSERWHSNMGVTENGVYPQAISWDNDDTPWDLGYLILRKKPKWKEPKEFGASAVSPLAGKNETMNIDTFHLSLCLGTSAIVAFEHAFREMTPNALIQVSKFKPGWNPTKLLIAIKLLKSHFSGWKWWGPHPKVLVEVLGIHNQPIQFSFTPPLIFPPLLLEINLLTFFVKSPCW